MKNVNVIDLKSYLPKEAVVTAYRRPRRRFGSIVAALECLVTLLIALGFFVMLAALLIALF